MQPKCFQMVLTRVVEAVSSLEKLMLWGARITIAISPDPAFSLLASLSTLHQSVLAKTDFSAVLTYFEHQQWRIGEKRHSSFLQGAVILFWVVDPFGVYSKCSGSTHKMAVRMNIAKHEERTHFPKGKLMRWLSLFLLLQLPDPQLLPIIFILPLFFLIRRTHSQLKLIGISTMLFLNELIFWRMPVCALFYL